MDDDPVTIRLERWAGPWPDDDPDANFKADVALHATIDPLATIRQLSAGTGVPVGAIVHYVLARWASEPSAGLLELGPTMARRLAEVCDRAEAEDTAEARLTAYDQLRQMLSWLRLGLGEPPDASGAGQTGQDT
jgi:hypothetical protein